MIKALFSVFTLKLKRKGWSFIHLFSYLLVLLLSLFVCFVLFVCVSFLLDNINSKKRVKCI